MKINPALSDLFFNHTHDEYVRYSAERNDRNDESMEQYMSGVRDAIWKDAKEFHNCYMHLFIDAFSIDDLADDFMKRL